jgi:hypothetical protein
MIVANARAFGAASTAMRSIIAVIVAVAACGGGQKEVAVKGTDNELVKLVGEWQGDYKGTESGRSGPVSFTLQLGSHTAEGEVVMGGTTPLKIEFVAVKGGQVKGTIAPYTDPNCACQVETSFLGNVSGDAISGMFETKIGASGQIQTGSWQVSRKAK